MQQPTKIYRNTGETADMQYSIDARDAVERHPDEWSFAPFSPNVIKDTLAKQAKLGMQSPA